MRETTDIVDIQATIAYMADELKPLLVRQPVMIGIHTGGAWIAEHLHALLDLADPLGMLDISFYRDDFTRVGVNPTVKTSNLPVNFEDRHVILVDDVLHTGRTIRAALNEIFDYGRPASVLLACLVERGGRELPNLTPLLALLLARFGVPVLVGVMTLKSSFDPSAATSTSISSPFWNSPRRIFSESGSSMKRWIARFRGRAPYCSS